MFRSSLAVCFFFALLFGQFRLEALPSEDKSSVKGFFVPALQELTYDFLRVSSYTDHVPIFKQLFDQVSIGKMLEFGLGLGTKFFLDHVEELTSFELIVGGQTPAWFYTCKELYKDYCSWKPILYRGSAACDLANRITIDGQNPLLYYNGAYFLELDKLIATLTRKTSYELAFVDPGVFNRADFVILLFNRVDIIVAHDTNDRVYQWDRIYTPSNYEKIVFTEGQGVTFWVKKGRTDVIQALSGR